MQITLNGQHNQTDCTNLQQLVQQLDLGNKRFAVELNEQLIPKSKLEQTQICDNDRIEIVIAVGGG